MSAESIIIGICVFLGATGIIAGLLGALDVNYQFWKKNRKKK